jgi:hypothetical protein
VKNGSKITSIWSAAIPDPVSLTATAINLPAPGPERFSSRNGVDGLYVNRKLPFPLHRISAVHGEVDESRFELGDVGHCEARWLAEVELDTDPPSDERPDKLRDAFDLGAHIEYLRRQRLTASESQELSGELGCAVDRVRDRIDIAATPFIGQLSAPEKIRRRPYDSEKIVEVMRNAAGKLTDGFHFLCLPERFFSFPSFGDVDRLRKDA